MSLLFYYPNRPTLVPPDPAHPLNPNPDYINSLENSKRYVAEIKWNGDNTSLYTDDMRFMNRQNETLRNYVPSLEIKEELLKFPLGCIVNLELVHYHTKTVKDLLVCHCVMAWKGKPLFGKSWGDSRKILENEFEFGQHVVLSKVWKKGFWKLFKETDGEIHEGIILKDPSGKLVFSTNPIPNVSWMLKIRKRCKKYPY
jgi:ATP-dependent DNA ligase